MLSPTHRRLNSLPPTRRVMVFRLSHLVSVIATAKQSLGRSNGGYAVYIGTCMLKSVVNCHSYDICMPNPPCQNAGQEDRKAKRDRANSDSNQHQRHYPSRKRRPPPRKKCECLPGPPSETDCLTVTLRKALPVIHGMTSLHLYNLARAKGWDSSW